MNDEMRGRGMKKRKQDALWIRMASFILVVCGMIFLVVALFVPLQSWIVAGIGIITVMARGQSQRNYGG